MLNRPTTLGRCTIVVLLTTYIFGQTAFADDAIKFEIPAQPAAKGLNLYAEQADMQILFPYAAVKDVETNEVVGELDKDLALDTLLADTGLEVVHGRNNTATVRPISTAKDVQTPGKSQPASAPVLMAQNQTSAPRNPTSQPETSSNDDETPLHIEEIIVLGSNIRGIESKSSPVITIERAAIDASGFGSVEQLMQSLPQNFGGGASQDEFTSGDGRNNVSNEFGGSAINLRGIGVSSTLVLLNGRRVASGGFDAQFVDISMIPLSALEKVEVLTDGASAIYGADAIGGVVNFVLKDDYDGAETRLRYGSVTDGDLDEVRFSQILGNSWGTGNVLLSYEYFNRDNLDNSERAFTASTDLRSLGGEDFRIAGGNPANVDAGGQTFAIPAGQDGTSLVASDFDPAALPNLFNVREVTDLLPEQERHSVFVAATQDLSDKLELFGEARYSNREGDRRVGKRLLDLTVPDTNAFFVDPTASGLTSVEVTNYSFNRDMGPNIVRSEVESFGAVVGIRFDFVDSWYGEVFASFSNEDASRVTSNGLNLNTLTSALAQSEAQMAFNPFGDGSFTNTTVLDSLRVAGNGVDTEQELSMVNASLGGTIAEVPGGSIKLAAGIEYRDESLQNSITEGFEIDAPIIVPGNNSSRDVLASYIEVYVPIVGDNNNRPGLRRLELTLAARYEDYSDFGSNTSPKFGVAWSPTESINVRGTIGESFRAPLLRDLDNTTAGPNSVIFLPGFILGGQSAMLLQGGNPTLDAETATTWTFGIDIAPEGSGFGASLTYFDIEFENQVEIPSSNPFDYFRPEFASFATPMPPLDQVAALVNDPFYFDIGFGIPIADLISGAIPVDFIFDARLNNTSRTEVNGIEAQVSYEFEVPAGNFVLGLSGTHLNESGRALLDSQPLIDQLNVLGNPIDLRLRGSLSWSRGGWNANGFVNFTDSYTNDRVDPVQDIDSWTTVDAQISYQLSDRASGWLSDTKFSLSVQNLFDEDPPRVIRFSFPGAIAYDSANADPLGRFIAFELIKGW